MNNSERYAESQKIRIGSQIEGESKGFFSNAITSKENLIWWMWFLIDFVKYEFPYDVRHKMTITDRLPQPLGE